MDFEPRVSLHFPSWPWWTDHIANYLSFSPVQTGFCAVGVKNGTLFSDIDLTQKVRTIYRLVDPL